MKLVTAYTPSYRDFAERLLGSLGEFRDHMTLLGYPEIRGPGAWDANCLWKPVVVERWWSAHPRRTRECVWVLDADQVKVGHPLLFDSLEGGEHDCAVILHEGRSDAALGKRLSAGCVGFAPTVGGRAALSAWAHRCMTNELRGKVSLPEQAYLWQALYETPGMRVLRLPISYGARVEDEPDDTKVVFRHVPASREMRDVINSLAGGPK